jgi:DNA polymerase-1
MLQAYARGEDIHRKTAAALAGVRLKEVTPEQRQAAKAVNFGLLYGQGPKGLARYAKTNYGVDMSEKEAREAREAFFQTYPGLRRWQTETARQAEGSNRVVTPGGRIRDFAREERGYQYTEALNTPVQGGAAEVLLATLPKLDKYLEGLDAKLVNIVHDEIVLEVAEQDAERAKQAVEKAMVEGMLAMFPNASTVGLVEAKAGANWAEVK